MKIRLLAVLVVFSAFVASCGGGGATVASVNGEDISADYMASLRANTGRSLSITTEEFRDDLSRNIIRLAIAQAANTEFGIEVSEFDIGQRIANPPERWQALFVQLAGDPNVTEVFTESQAELTLLRDLVASELIRREPGFIEQTIAESPQDVTAGCVRHILLPSQAEADAALARLESGEDFVALAAELSTDAATGGDPVAGCPVDFGGFVPPFAVAASTAPLDEVVGPVETEFGFHLIRVEQRQGPPSLDQLRDDPAQFYPENIQSQFFTPWFNDAVRNAEITVTTSVGRWSPEGVGIIPPGQ